MRQNVKRAGTSNYSLDLACYCCYEVDSHYMTQSNIQILQHFSQKLMRQMLWKSKVPILVLDKIKGVPSIIIFTYDLNNAFWLCTPCMKTVEI